MVMKKLATYVIAGALALGVACSKEDYEIKSIGERKENPEKTVENEEMSLENTIKRLFSCKPGDYDFALKHVYIPEIHEKLSGLELEKTQQRFIDDYKKTFVSEEHRDHERKSFVKWKDLISSVDLKRISETAYCHRSENREKYADFAIQFNEINIKEVKTAKAVKERFRINEDRYNQREWKRVPDHNEIYLVRIKANMRGRHGGKWTSTLYFTKINNQWLFIDN